MHDSPTTANDNPVPAKVRISLTDLAKQSGLSENLLLERLAEIMNRREEKNDG